MEEKCLQDLMIIRCEDEPTLDEEILQKAIVKLVNKNKKFQKQLSIS